MASMCCRCASTMKTRISRVSHITPTISNSANEADQTGCGYSASSMAKLRDRAGGNRLDFVVRRLECDFRKPARISDVLEIRTRLSSASGARLKLSQEITRGEESLFVAAVVLALVDKAGRPRRVPAAMAAALAESR